MSWARDDAAGCSCALNFTSPTAHQLPRASSRLPLSPLPRPPFSPHTENVRNFVAYNDGRVFRLVVRTLLELGYQVCVCVCAGGGVL